MAKLLLGKEVIAPLLVSLKERSAALKARGILPTLALVRVGEKSEDLSYQKSLEALCEELGIRLSLTVFPEDSQKEALLDSLHALDRDPKIHGILLFRPLSKSLSPWEGELRNAISPEKDPDGMTDLSLSGVFQGKGLGFAPATAEACLVMLDHYGYDLSGKNVCIIGRSPVVGRPLSMLLLQRNATVTICHSKTQKLSEICRRADILISAAGSLRLVTKDFVSEGQTLLDVSINWDPEKITKRGKGGISGDADFAAVEPLLQAISPVPGGLGSVTVPVLLSHLLTAAENSCIS